MKKKKSLSTITRSVHEGLYKPFNFRNNLKQGIEKFLQFKFN